MITLPSLSKKIEKLDAELRNWIAKPERDVVAPSELKSALEKIEAKMAKAQENFDALTDDRKQDARDLQDKLEKLRKDLTELISRAASNARSGGGNANRNIQVDGSNVLSPFTDINFKAGSNVTLSTANNQTTKYTEITIASSGGSGITIGSTTITSGTDTRVLFDNAGVVGEYTISGTGSVAMTTSPTFVTPTLGAASATSVTATGALRSNTSLILEETGAGTDTITIVAPASIAASYSLTLPVDDGNSGEVLSTDGAGVLSWVATTTFVPTAITVANEATDTTCFPLFVTAATGDLGPKSNAGLTFNSSTALLTATLIAGTTSVTSASILASSNDSGALGASGTAFSDLFLASGAVINFLAGDVTITHAAGILTVAGSGAGDFRVTTAGTNTASVVTVGGTQTLTNKSLTSPLITNLTSGRVTFAGASGLLTDDADFTFATDTLTVTKIASTTLAGTMTLAENSTIALDPAGSADGKFTGITIAGTAGATLAFGDLVYLQASDSRWELADADAASTSGDVILGMCVLAAAADGDPTTLLLIGNIRADAAFPALTIGAPAYVSTTAGDIQTAQPTGVDDVIRRVGFALTADELLFNPSNDYVTHT